MRARCKGTFELLQDNTQALNLATCSIPFTTINTRIVCEGELVNSSYSTLTQGYNLFQLDDFTPNNGFIRYPLNATNELINTPTLPVDNSQVLSPADYSALITLALPALVIAFSFNMIFRQIINRN